MLDTYYLHCVFSGTCVSSIPKEINLPCFLLVGLNYFTSLFLMATEYSIIYLFHSLPHQFLVGEYHILTCCFSNKGEFVFWGIWQYLQISLSTPQRGGELDVLLAFNGQQSEFSVSLNGVPQRSN